MTTKKNTLDEDNSKNIINEEDINRNKLSYEDSSKNIINEEYNSKNIINEEYNSKNIINEEYNSENILDEKKRIIKFKSTLESTDLPINMKYSLIHIYLCTNSIIKNSNLNVVEELDECLEKFEFTGQIDNSIIFEILKNIENNISLFKFNIKTLIPFLIKVMYKKTKLELGMKMYSYEILSCLDKNCFEELFIYDLPYIANFKDIKVKFLLDFYRNNKDFSVFNLIFKDNRIGKFEKILKNTISYTNNDFICSFVDFYISNSTNEEVENGISIIFDILEFLLEELSLKRCDIDKNYIKRIFNYLLNLMLVKTNPKRFKIANFLIKTNLKNIVFNKKKVFKICKKLLDDKSIRIYEVSIDILSIFDYEYVLSLLEKCNDGDKLRVIFKYLRDIDNPIIYRKFLEAKNMQNTRDINIHITNIPLFAKIFYNFYNKEVVKYVEIKKLDISDIYTLDLALYYSKYYPNRIDEEIMASLILENSSNVLRNIKVIEILTNVHENLRTQVKNKLIEKFKIMILQSPYVKSIGLFFSKIGFIYNRENIKSDYILVMYSAMNHPDFIRYFEEFVWSTNKVRSLIYILQFRPDFGLNYKYKLNEILLLNNEDVMAKYNLLEFLSLLTNLIDKEFEDYITEFFCKFIMDNKNLLITLLQNNDQSIKIQVYKLLLKATTENILIKEEVVPLLVIYHKYDNNLLVYSDLIIKNIQSIFNSRILQYKKYNRIYDEYFLKNIFKKPTNLPLLNEEDICLKYYVLYINFENIDSIVTDCLLFYNEILQEFICKLKKKKITNINDFFLM